MAGRRFLYLLVLLGSAVFYIAYGQWLAFLVLVTVLAVPWISLALSLPAIFRFRAAPAGPQWTGMHQECELWLLGSCAWPMPPFQGQLRLRRLMTGESWRYRENKGVPTDHCGGFLVTAEKVRICDYLGLFAFPVRKKDTLTVLVRPEPLEVPVPEDLRRQVARAWKPKFGGGFAENHELRLYRPGDSLNQVHWKLSLREPMEPRLGRVLLTLNLRGTPAELDRMLGRLLWLGTAIGEQGLAFEIRALTGNGVLTLAVSGEEDLKKAVDTLLCTPAAREGDLREQTFEAAWQYHIGGDAHDHP